MKTAEQKKEYLRLYRIRNRDKILAMERERSKVRQKDPVYRDNHYYAMIKRKYNLSKDKYLAILKYQSAKCAICLRPPAKNRRLHVDHNHFRGHVRGLLCAECNWYRRFADADKEFQIRFSMYGAFIQPWEAP